jgi:hypothetical protein
MLDIVVWGIIDIHNVFKSGSISVIRCNGWKGCTYLGLLEIASLSHLTMKKFLTRIGIQRLSNIISGDKYSPRYSGISVFFSFSHKEITEDLLDISKGIDLGVILEKQSIYLCLTTKLQGKAYH